MATDYTKPSWHRPAALDIMPPYLAQNIIVRALKTTCYSANFARGAVGGEESNTLTKAELPNVSIELGAEAIK